MRRGAAVLAALALVIGACAGSTGPSPATTTTTNASTSPTTTTLESTTSTTTNPTTTTSPDRTTALGESPASCSGPAGYTVSYPSDWWANDGSVTDECGLFGPQPVDLQPATDVTAPINLFVDPVEFRVAAAPSDSSIELDRAVTTIDGARAVRLVRETEEGLLPAGTESTTYVVEFASDRTMFLSTSDLDAYDYERNVELVDAMARTLDLAIDAPPGLIARYRGGGVPFDVVATVRGTDTCFTVTPGDDTTCLPPPDGAASAALAESVDGVAFGLARPGVFEIEAVDGVGFLPVPITGSDLSAWAVPVDGAPELVALDDRGRSIGAVPMGSN